MLTSPNLKPIAGFVLGIVLLFNGCASISEKNTISSFSEGLEHANYEQLQTNSSNHFQRNVLRTPEAAEDLKILRIPTGDVEVVEVEKVSNTEKRVKVEIGEKKRRVLYKLVKASGETPWVVDDIYMSQKFKGKLVTKSVSEQMNLLQAAREYLAIWDSGDRSNILETVDPELKAKLVQLPPSYLAELSNRISGGTGKSTPFRPKASINQDRAVVELPRPDGKVVLSLKLDEKKTWHVTDLAIESRTEGKHIDSLKKHVDILHTAISFLDAFSRDDKHELNQLATNDFFNSSIAPAQLGTVTLPNHQVPASQYQVKTVKNRSDVIIEDKGEFVRLNLIGETEADRSGAENFRVDNVVIYDSNTQQEKQLGALLTAHSIVRVFSDAMQRRQLDSVQQVASGDFNMQVWERVSPRVARVMPFEGLPAASPKIITTNFRGPLTQVTVSQGNQPVTYIVRKEANGLKVDDILIENPNGQEMSIKEQLSAVAVIYEFAMNVHDENIPALQRLASLDFNRRIWTQTDSIPSVIPNLVSQLTAPFSKLEKQGDDAVAILGDMHTGARIHLSKQNGRFVINDAVIVDARRGTPVSMKQAMRIHLASHGRGRSDVRQVSGTFSNQYGQTPTATSARRHQTFEIHDDGSRRPSVLPHSQQKPREFSPHQQPKSIHTESLSTPIPVDF